MHHTKVKKIRAKWRKIFLSAEAPPMTKLFGTDLHF